MNGFMQVSGFTNGKLSLRQEDASDAVATVDAFRDALRDLAVFDNRNWGYNPTTNNPSLPLEVEGAPGAATYYKTDNVPPKWLRPQYDNKDGSLAVVPRVERVTLSNAFRIGTDPVSGQRVVFPHLLRPRKLFFGCIHGLGGPVEIKALPDAPSVAVNPAAGNLSGNYTYRITFVIDGVETEGGPASEPVSPANEQVDLTDISRGPKGTTARKIYRVTGGGLPPWKLVAAVNDNTTTSYTDNVADASLGSDIPVGPIVLDSVMSNRRGYWRSKPLPPKVPGLTPQQTRKYTAVACFVRNNTNFVSREFGRVVERTRLRAEIVRLDYTAPDSAIVNIFGTVVGEHVASYRIEYGEGIAPTSWQAVNSAQPVHAAPVTNDVLDTWDVSTLDQALAYTVRVVTWDDGGCTGTRVGRGTLSGKVVKPDGTTPAADALVVAVHDSYCFGAATALTVSDGSFLVKDLEAGDYHVEVLAPDGLTATTGNMLIVSEEETSTGTITLSPAGSVAGVVKDAQGTAVPNAAVRLIGVTDPVGAEYEDNAVAGGNGAFQFTNVPPGDYILDANVSGYFVQSGVQLTLGSGQTLANQDVILMKPLSLLVENNSLTPRSTVVFTAQMQDADGDPIAGAAVNWSAVSPEGTILISDAETDFAGVARAVLQTGASTGIANDVRVATQDSEFSAQASVTPQAGTNSIVLSASPTEVDPNGTSPVTLTANVTDSAGNPASGVVVSFTASAGTLNATSATTDASGNAAVVLTAPTEAGSILLQAEVVATGQKGQARVRAKATSRKQAGASPTGLEYFSGVYAGAKYHLIVVDRAQNTNLKARVMYEGTMNPLSNVFRNMQQWASVAVNGEMPLVVINGTLFATPISGKNKAEATVQVGKTIKILVGAPLGGVRVPSLLMRSGQPRYRSEKRVVVAELTRRYYFGVGTNEAFTMAALPDEFKTNLELRRNATKVLQSFFTLNTSVPSWSLGGVGPLISAGNDVTESILKGTGWPNFGGKRARSLIAWSSDSQQLFLICCEEPKDKTGWTANEASKFLREEINRLMPYNPSYGIFLDGGGSTQLYLRDLTKLRTWDSQKAQWTSSLGISNFVYSAESPARLQPTAIAVIEKG